MALTTPSFVDAIQPFTRNNYKTLFTPQGGYIVWNEKEERWAVSKKAPEDLPAYYSTLSKHLISSKDYRDIPKLEAFVQRFNALRTLAEFTPSVLNPKATYIYFNSKSAGYSFLSNFFPTLVLFRDHNNPEYPRLYPSSENAYQAHKVAILSRKPVDEVLESDDKEHKSSCEFTIDKEQLLIEALEEIATATPSESKKMAQLQSNGEAPTDETAQMKAALIHEVVMKKFQDNPVLRLWLSDTRVLDLIEDSNDRFWGAKNPTDPSLKKSYTKPVSIDSRNVMGKTLMLVRGVFAGAH